MGNDVGIPELADDGGSEAASGADNYDSQTRYRTICNRACFFCALANGTAVYRNALAAFLDLEKHGVR
jgi:hypothetical protein